MSGQWECDLQYRRQSGICAYTFWPGLINEIPLSITMCFCSFFLLQGIPTHSIFTIQGKDTVDFSLADADYKVVTYIDSVGCTSCKLQLPRWKLFMQEVDSTLNRLVPFVFYFTRKI